MNDLPFLAPAPDETAVPPDIAERLAEIRCDQCDGGFEPRQRSGGKVQRFCSPECRRLFHAQNLPTPKAHVGATTPPVIPRPPDPTPISEPPEPDGADFAWNDHEDIVIPTQPAVAVYFNPRGAVVIRQEGLFSSDEDHWIYIQLQNLDHLIDRLQRIARREIEPG